jgi:hypothetical protein
MSLAWVIQTDHPVNGEGQTSQGGQNTFGLHGMKRDSGVNICIRE